MTQESGATSPSNIYLQNDDIVQQQTCSNQYRHDWKQTDLQSFKPTPTQAT
jgi:hypothetical protein